MANSIADGGTAAAIDWTAQLEQHSPWLRKVLRGRIGDRHEVDDLLQDIALAVFGQSAKPDDPDRIAAWLYRLAVRQTINFHRRRGRKSYARPQPEVDVLCEQDNPLDWLLASEQRSTIRKAITQLSMRDREILMLKYTENWSCQHLATHLGVKLKTVEYRLMRARRQLRHLLSPVSNTIEI